MKKYLFITAICLQAILGQAQTITIAEARELPEETEVTVSGVTTNGSELGIIRYMQDGTGGIAAYGPILESVNRGDSITVTGILYLYNGLLEISPTTDVVNHGPATTPVLPEITELSAIGEDTESHLITIEDAIFADGGGTFQANTTYNFSSGDDEGVIFINSTHALVGELIPIGIINITGISSQFTFTGFGGYQIIPRDGDDLVSLNAINIISSIDQTNQNETGFTLSWTTDLASSTEAFYTSNIDGSNIEGTHISNTENTTSHTLEFEGLEPGEVYFTQVFSVLGEDTAFSNIFAFATISEGEGRITAYFNNSVDTSFANPAENTALATNLKDTIVAYINRTQYTLDIAAYNINNSEIADAINDAYDRGVEIRFIAEGQNANVSMASFNDDIPVLLRQNATSSGMHNKFIICDSETSDSSYVLTGSTNLTNNNLFTDPNNLIVLQDKALAKAFTIEFNEMWGSDGNEPNAALSRFGEDKINNTPEKFVIGGKNVELYFSPSDGPTNAIGNALESADASIEFALLLITENQLADILLEKSYDFFMTMKGVIEDANTTGSDFEELAGSDIILYQHSPEPSLHHKYGIVDNSDFDSDPLVITGSHNWSASAASSNDENTLIIHDAALANQYYQEFMARYNQVAVSIEENEVLNDFSVFPNPATEFARVTFTSAKSIESTIYITDITGKTVFSKSVVLPAGVNSMDIPLDALSEGMYILNVNGNWGSQSKKIVVKK